MLHASGRGRAAVAAGGVITFSCGQDPGNPSGAFQNAPGIFDSVNGQDTQPVVGGGSPIG